MNGALQIGGEGKDSNLRYGLHRIMVFADNCLKPLSHLSETVKSQGLPGPHVKCPPATGPTLGRHPAPCQAPDKLAVS